MPEKLTMLDYVLRITGSGNLNEAARDTLSKLPWPIERCQCKCCAHNGDVIPQVK